MEKRKISMPDDIGLYKFCWNMDVENEKIECVFIATKSSIKTIIGREACFWVSEKSFQSEFEEDDFTLISDDKEYIWKTFELFGAKKTICGENPFLNLV